MQNLNRSISSILTHFSQQVSKFVYSRLKQYVVHTFSYVHCSKLFKYTGCTLVPTICNYFYYYPPLSLPLHPRGHPSFFLIIIIEKFDANVNIDIIYTNFPKHSVVVYRGISLNLQIQDGHASSSLEKTHLSRKLIVI